MPDYTKNIKGSYPSQPPNLPLPSSIVDQSVTPVLPASDGTVAAPTISFLLDGNTGIYRPGDDQIGFSTGGVSRMTLDASGSLIVPSLSSGGGSQVVFADSTGSLSTEVFAYSEEFNSTTDWTLSGTEYQITIEAATHGRGGNPSCRVIDSNLDDVWVSTNVGITGTVTFSVPAEPDTRFSGTLYIRI